MVLSSVTIPKDVMVSFGVSETTFTSVTSMTSGSVCMTSGSVLSGSLSLVCVSATFISTP
eukprot:UN18584